MIIINANHKRLHTINFKLILSSILNISIHLEFMKSVMTKKKVGQKEYSLSIL